jgi:hypothetical protein
MKKLFILLTTLLTNAVFAQLTYVDNFDGVYPYPIIDATYDFDLNNDQLNDIRLFLDYGTFNTVCGQTGGTGHIMATFKGINNVIGQNKVNAPVNLGSTGIDCSNDTLNSSDLWNNSSLLYFGWFTTQQLCNNIGIGSHKQGFRLVLTNPANGALGYKYGYIDYSITNGGDVIIHGWYYENTFNVPIVANSQLQYPYDGNCIHYDTVTVQDTLVTQVYDTITTHINVYDTVLVSVTDTLIINTTLNLPAPNNTNIITVYPNPASDHITIDNGNFALMNGYSIKIENSTGQQVFNASVNQAQFYIDVSTWTGNGLYFIHLIDPSNNTVTIRKLVVQ